MPHHDWSERDFDWDALNSAIDYIMTTWKRYGRIGSHGKEKYGTFRDHPYFWDGGLHTLMYPGYVHIVNRFIYFKLDRYIIKPLTRFTGLYFCGVKYQNAVYNYAIQRACAKYPHITDEIVSSLEAYELVKPGIFGKVCGTTIHNKYWRRYV